MQFVLSDAGMRGQAVDLRKESNGDLFIRNNRFTRCEPGNNGWGLNTSSLLIEEDEVFATARNAVIRLKSVPIFYTPYLKFPVTDDRVSGFLFPTMGYADEDGVDVFDALLPQSCTQLRCHTNSSLHESARCRFGGRIQAYV